MSFQAVRTFKRLRQRVVVYDGQSSYTDPNLECLSATYQHGQPSSAMFGYTPALWDTNVHALARRMLYVFVDETGTGAFALVFQGFLMSANGQLDPGTNKKTFSAISALAMLKEVHVGQSEGRSSIVYPAIDPVTLEKTNWNAQSVLADIFAKMPSFYKQLFRLGNTSILGSTAAPIKEFSFNLSDYLAAVGHCLSVFGDISFRERFTGIGSPIYLDFFRVNAPSSAYATLTIPKRGESIYTTGANVQAMNSISEAQGCKSRFFGYGKAVACILSAISFGGGSDEKLLKGWPVVPVTIGGITRTNEEWVILNPERANKNNKEYFHPDCEFCFRLWYLPRSLWPFTKLKGCKLRKASTPNNEAEASFANRKGAEMKVQIWKENWILEPADEAGNDYVASFYEEDLQARYALLDGWKDGLEDNWFCLKNAEDGLNQMSATTDAKGKPMFTYQPANIGITLAVQMEKQLRYDTGQIHAGHDLNFAVIGKDGLGEPVDCSEYEYIQVNLIGNAPDQTPISARDATGATRTWTSCVVFDEELKEWQSFSGQTIIRNDYPKMRNLCELKLMETNRRRRTSETTIPFLTTAIGPGMQVQVNNKADHIFENLCVGTVTLDFVAAKTTVNFDNVKPAKTITLNG